MFHSPINCIQEMQIIPQTMWNSQFNSIKRLHRDSEEVRTSEEENISFNT